MPPSRAPGDGESTRPVWVDIDNPPQVQYLYPFIRVLRERGFPVVVTARDHGITHELLRQHDVEFVPVGAHSGSSTLRKVDAVIRRAGTLARSLRGRGILFSIFASRSAALASRRLGITGFALIDYEFVDLRAFRFARSFVVHPDVIADPLRARGIKPERLIGYDGLKEHISCSDLDLEQAQRLDFPEGDTTKILVRPPDDRSHYFRAETGELTSKMLEFLATRPHATVVLSPRYDSQVGVIDGARWSTPPVVLEGAIPSDRLLASVDAVVTAGGTMAREAAFLGIPSYSVYMGPIGGVDKSLAAARRLKIVRSAADLDGIDVRRALLPRLPGANPTGQLVDVMLSNAHTTASDDDAR